MELTLISKTGMAVYTPEGFNDYHIKVIERVADICECSYNDAAGISGTDFYNVLQSFNEGLSVEVASAFILL